MMDDQKFKCPSHPDKPSAFYCFAHSTSACLKCVAVHIQCQVENQFQPLEEVYESVLNNALAESELLTEKIARSSETINDDQNKLMMLDNLRDIDLQTIGDCFDDLKKKVDLIKERTLKNYREYYGSIREKVSGNNEKNAKQLEKEVDAQEKIKRLQERLHQEGSTLEEKRARAMELWRELEKIKEEIRMPFEFEKVNDELESLMNRENVLSVIEKMTLQYSKIPSHVSNFMKEYMKEYFIESENLVPEEGFGPESLEERIKGIEYLKEERLVYDENFLKALEEPAGAAKNLNKRLHQLRYCSNEINIFDCATEKFSSYELYTTNSFKTPFLIFNNCGSVIYKNHLIFLFGGEDPAANDKSSNRVFCVNLNKAMNNKVIAYEICLMTAARQEFTLTTVGHNIYAISGYDSNKPKENRVIPKCERLDVKSKKFCDMRNIDYPRQAACSVNVNNTHIYVFGGQNPKYLNYYVDKIERYTINLDDWSSLKYSVMNEFLYEPGMNSSAFRLNDGEIMILGGKRDQEVLNGYFVFDMKKLLIVKKEEKLFKEADNFYNQNNVELDSQKRIQLFSSNKANYVYELGVKDAASYTLSVNVIQDQDSKVIQ